ncbi:MAG: argininosuccinate lyase [Eubacteriales bacterium]|jgi:argininosuccinate lyase|nr:argininosuccinate lyase [Clostridiales bacterium]
MSKSEKMWAGRFKKELDSRVNSFNSSISFDSRMYRQDIQGSMAHAAMLARQKIISSEDAEAIIAGLGDILSDLETGVLEIDHEAEDIHMFVEAELTARIGEPGKKLHTARSRNDQVALDIRLHLREEIKEVERLILKLLEAIFEKAKAHVSTIMPGYTHLQRAQPVTFAHHILAYAQMLRRDIGRLDDAKKRMNVSPLGSCALAGTTYPIDRESVAVELGMDGVTENSMDGVSDRDFVLELASALSIIMVHLSRFSEEIILWSSSEFGFVTLDDAYSTGSSIMPQKKNPDIAELVRGKTGRVTGSLVSLLMVMKGLPLAYNKDMQEDKEAIFDALDTVKICLEMFTAMFETLAVNSEAMRCAASGGFIAATDCADYLVRHGLPFRDAYKIVGQLVAYCIECGKTFEELTLDEYKSFHPSFDGDIYDAINLENCVNRRDVIGGPAVASTEAQMRSLAKFIESRK